MESLVNVLPKGMELNAIIGRNALFDQPNKAQIAAQLASIVSSVGIVVLAETIPQFTQRLYRLLNLNELTPSFSQKLIEAEEKIYQNPNDAMVNWNEKDLRAAFESAGFQVKIDVKTSQTQLLITPHLIERWFTFSTTPRPSYASHLSAVLTEKEIQKVHQVLIQQLQHKTVNWSSQIAFVQARLNSQTELNR